MLHDAQRTSAPSACSVSISTAVWIVMCRLPAMRAPRSGCSGANSSRIAMRPGISVSAIAISLRPQSASDRSATSKSVNRRDSFAAFIGHSVRQRATRCGSPERRDRPLAASSRGSTSAVAGGIEPTPSLARASPGCNAPRGVEKRILANGTPRANPVIRANDRRSAAPRSEARGFAVEQRVREARLALVETVGVKRLLECEKLVIEVMTDFVAYGAQETFERHHLLSLRGAHPHADARRRAPFLRLVEPVQFTVIAGRPPREHAHPDGRHVISARKRVDDPLARTRDAG